MANLITYARMVFVIPIAYSIYKNSYTAALVLFIIAALTDWLDGFVARRTGTVSETGKVMDQIADKVLITSVMVVFVEAKFIPSWLVIAVVWRDFVVSGARILAAKQGRVVAANIFGKVKTVSQMVLVILILARDLFYVQVLTDIFIWIVLVSTIFSGAIYIYQNRRVFSI